MNYRHFDSGIERNQVMEIGNGLADYLHDNKIDNVMFIDASARLGWYVLKHSWQQKYSDEKMPNMYFTNPDGYNRTIFRSRKSVAKKFNKTYKTLAKNKDASILLFDVCMHTGNTLRPILETMDKAGYSDVKIGLVQLNRCISELNPDFIAADYIPVGLCKPFGKNGLVAKGGRSLLSSPNYSRHGLESEVCSNGKEHDVDLKKEIRSMYQHGKFDSNFHNSLYSDMLSFERILFGMLFRNR